MFTRQHYKAVGYILAKNQAPTPIIDDFVRFFQEDNQRFSEDTFRTFIIKQGMGNSDTRRNL
jgi:hypothetical protein